MIKKSRRLSFFVMFFFFSFFGLVTATEFSDNFDTDPFVSRWINERGVSVWDSTNFEIDMGDNQAREGARYVANNPGSIDEEAQVTFQHTNQFGENTQGGPAVRMKSDGTDEWYWVTVNAANDTYTLFRNEEGGSTQLAQGTLTITTGDFLTIRLSAQGSVGGSVVLNVWIINHGASKPTDPGWIGNDNTPNLTYTDTSATRLDEATNIQVGIAGEATGLSTDSRHDFFKARALSDRTGSSYTPPPPPSPTPTPPSPTPTPPPPTPTPTPTPLPPPPPASGTPTFDTSDYRQNTYGPPDHYCDPAKSYSVSGAGTLSNPWNMNQCLSQPVPGDVIGILPGVMIPMISANDDNTPTFNPANSGTGDAISNRIVYVTKYAAIGLSNVETNPDRTEFRHNGSAPDISSSGTGIGTGSAMIGTLNRNYITFDGFYIDAAYAYPREDSGTIRADNSTGTKFLNFVIRGTTTRCASNCVVYRPNNSHDTTLYNFRVYGFHNNPVGTNGVSSLTRQGYLFSDSYADQNFRIEHGLIEDIDSGIFTKGSSVPEGYMNYGTIRYTVLRAASRCLMFNSLHASIVSVVEYNLCYDTITTNGYMDISGSALSFNCVPVAGTCQNLVFRWNTIAKVDASSINTGGALDVSPNTISGGIQIYNNIFDNDNGSFGHELSFMNTLPAVLNNNYYYKNGAIESYTYNGIQYGPNNGNYPGFRAAVQAVNSSLETASMEGVTSPFTNRAGDVYTIPAGHIAKTMSTTGGEIGAYAGNEVVGLILPSSSYPSSGSTPPPPPVASPVPGDLNLDHVINSLDWSIMNSQWFTGNSQSDLRVDGQVNSLDFAILSSNWGRTW